MRRCRMVGGGGGEGGWTWEKISTEPQIVPEHKNWFIFGILSMKYSFLT